MFNTKWKRWDWWTSHCLTDPRRPPTPKSYTNGISEKTVYHLKGNKTKDATTKRGGLKVWGRGWWGGGGGRGGVGGGVVGGGGRWGESETEGERRNDIILQETDIDHSWLRLYFILADYFVHFFFSFFFFPFFFFPPTLVGISLLFAWFLLLLLIAYYLANEVDGNSHLETVCCKIKLSRKGSSKIKPKGHHLRRK